MDELKQKLVTAGFRGELDDSSETRDIYSHDASLFEIRPELVAMPMDSQDVQTIISTVAAAKKHNSNLSVTARSAGTDMAGGAINDSIIVDFAQHLNKLEDVSATEGHA